MRARTAMVLGAGRGQVPLMRLCQKYGWRVVAVTPEGDYPGIGIADEVRYANVRDVEACLAIAMGELPEAVLCDQLDAAVLACAHIAEALELPGNKPKAVFSFVDKAAMRARAASLGVAVPEYVVARSADEAVEMSRELSYPLMMKPTDSAASRGVCKVDDERALLDGFATSASYSSCGSVIVEEFVCGPEYVVESLVKNGNVRPLVVGKREYFEVPGAFIPSSTIFVDVASATGSDEATVLEANSRLTDSCGLDLAITHGEFIVDHERGKTFLVEIAARGGGVFTSSDLIPAACGVDAVDMLVRGALGMPVDMGFELMRGASAYFACLLPEGEVSKLGGTDAVRADPAVIAAFFDNVYVGMKTHAISDKSSRKGPVLVRGSVAGDCIAAGKRIRKMLDIRVRTDHGEERAIW